MKLKKFYVSVVEPVAWCALMLSIYLFPHVHASTVFYAIVGGVLYAFLSRKLYNWSFNFVLSGMLVSMAITFVYFALTLTRETEHKADEALTASFLFALVSSVLTLSVRGIIVVLSGMFGGVTVSQENNNPNV